MVRKILFFTCAVMILVGLTGCGKPVVVSTSPANDATGVSTTCGQGVNFTTNTISVTFDVGVSLESGSSATISPALVQVDTGTATTLIPTILEMTVLQNGDGRVYLWYDDVFKLESDKEYTITVEQVWNRNRFMGAGNYNEPCVFSFTTQ